MIMIMIAKIIISYWFQVQIIFLEMFRKNVSSYQIF